MTSSPLFTSVAEFVVTMRPMSHVGVREGFRGGHIGQFCTRTTAERAAGCRHHEATHLGVGAGEQGLRQRRVLGIHRDDLSGRGGGENQVPADDQRLLVRQGQRASCLQRRESRAESDRAGDGVEHDIGLDIADELLASSAPSAVSSTWNCAACSPSISAFEPAARPTSSNRRGLARMTSSAWVPMEPVEPRTMMRRMTPA